MAPARKRLICCCDGTWMDSDDGFNKPTLIPYVPTATIQVPSNVTRLSRALTKVGLDGVHQIIYYHAGVGTSQGMLDSFTGGALGKGISENIREVYSFIVANYAPGDEIILVGFSRGAFTARSVAGMIDNIGLLTRAGMESFYAIFKDQENFSTPSYSDIFPTIPFPKKPRGSGKGREYKRRLETLDLTRVSDPDGTKICIQAVAVWDTVGSLGIPSIALFSKLGLPHASKEFKFYNTNLSGIIKHAFQALALDERRHPFAPAIWERKSTSKDTTVDLRQVWFPGSHSNVGGGYDDQEIADISLAWMMDQLASIAVAFQDEYIDIAFQQNVDYFKKTEKVSKSLFSRRDKQWAIAPIYDKHKPVRPWALGEIYDSSSGVYTFAGKQWRTPGLFYRANPDTGASTGIPMENTNERIHSSVRIRLELEGLGLDDNGRYQANALPKKLWRLRQVRMKVQDPIPYDASWGAGTSKTSKKPDDLRWIWEYCGPEGSAPRKRYMIEENLGPYERKLLLLSKGKDTTKRRKKRKKSTAAVSAAARTTHLADNIPDRASRVTASGFTASNTTLPLASPYREKEEVYIKTKERYSDKEPSYRDELAYGDNFAFPEKLPRTPPRSPPRSPPKSRVHYESDESIIEGESSRKRGETKYSQYSDRAVKSDGRKYKEFEAAEGKYKDWERQPTRSEKEYEKERRPTLMKYDNDRRQLSGRQY